MLNNDFYNNRMDSGLQYPESRANQSRESRIDATLPLTLRPSHQPFATKTTWYLANLLLLERGFGVKKRGSEVKEKKNRNTYCCAGATDALQTKAFSAFR